MGICRFPRLQNLKPDMVYASIPPVDKKGIIICQFLDEHKIKNMFFISKSKSIKTQLFQNYFIKNIIKELPNPYMIPSDLIPRFELFFFLSQSHLKFNHFWSLTFFFYKINMISIHALLFCERGSCRRQPLSPKMIDLNTHDGTSNVHILLHVSTKSVHSKFPRLVQNPPYLFSHP